MGCTRCAEHANFHSFKKVGTTTKGHSIYYSKPYLGIEKQFLETSIPNYIAHMDQAATSTWIYIFDAEGLERLEMPNIMVLRRFYKIVQERYRPTLMKIYIIHLNWKTKLLLSMLLPFVSKEAKARLCESATPLDLMEAGVSGDRIRHVFEDHASRPNLDLPHATDSRMTDSVSTVL